MTLLDSMYSPESKMVTDDDALLIDERRSCTIDGAMVEFKDTYKQNEIYVAVPMLDGMCYSWSDEFIMKIQEAMTTDRLVQFTTEELAAWRMFINFENYHTHSALTTDCNGNSVGCTIPDTNNISFVVCKDGTICETRCQPPGYEVEGEDIWKSLDSALMSLYNCEEINDCASSTQVDYSNSCPVT